MNRDDQDAAGARQQRPGQDNQPPPSPMPHARKQRKKAKLPALPKDAVPEPFLALAPAPVATPSPQPDQRAGVGNLILPSDYVRSVTSSQSRYSSALVSPPTVIAGRNRPAPQPRPLPTPAPLQQRGYVTNLLSPPFVVPGGRPASPLPQLSAPTRPPLIHQSSSRDGRTGRELPRTGRQSPAPPETPAEQQPAQSGPTRRRGQRPRVVNGSISRRSTVVSREDHLSRRASMRRVNVWDDSADPPPPFPFPTPSNARLPPTFSPVDLSPPPHTPLGSVFSSGTPSDVISHPPYSPPRSRSPPRPYSPPPTFDEAIAQSASRTPALSGGAATQEAEVLSRVAPAASVQDVGRARWNAGLVAGLTFSERAALEAHERGARLDGIRMVREHTTSTISDDSPEGVVTREDIIAAVRRASGTEELSKDDLDHAVQQAYDVLGGRNATEDEILAVARTALAAKAATPPGRQSPVPRVSPAVILESQEQTVLRRPEEQGAVYRVVKKTGRARAASNIDDSTSESRTQRASSDTVREHTAIEDQRETLSTSEDVVSIYGLGRSSTVSPGDRWDWPTPSRGSGRTTTTQSMYEVLQPPSESHPDSHPASCSGSGPGSGSELRAESPFHGATPQLARSESRQRSPPKPAVRESPLMSGQFSPVPLTASSMNSQRLASEFLLPRELQTKKEILEALEKETEKKTRTETPLPVVMQTLDLDNPMVSRSEEPGMLYRLVTTQGQALPETLTHTPLPSSSPAIRPTSEYSPVSPVPPSPEYTAGSAGSVQNQNRTPSMRSMRSIEPVPRSSYSPTSPRRPRSDSSSQHIPSRLGASDASDERASTSPAESPPAPPLPPRPPLEYITEYKHTGPGPATMSTPPSAPSASFPADPAVLKSLAHSTYSTHFRQISLGDRFLSSAVMGSPLVAPARPATMMERSVPASSTSSMTGVLATVEEPEDLGPSAAAEASLAAYSSLSGAPGSGSNHLSTLAREAPFAKPEGTAKPDVPASSQSSTEFPSRTSSWLSKFPSTDRMSDKMSIRSSSGGSNSPALTSVRENGSAGDDKASTPTRDRSMLRPRWLRRTSNDTNVKVSPSATRFATISTTSQPFDDPESPTAQRRTPPRTQTSPVVSTAASPSTPTGGYPGLVHRHSLAEGTPHVADYRQLALDRPSHIDAQEWEELSNAAVLHLRSASKTPELPPGAQAPVIAQLGRHATLGAKPVSTVLSSPTVRKTQTPMRAQSDPRRRTPPAEILAAPPDVATSSPSALLPAVALRAPPVEATFPASPRPTQATQRTAPLSSEPRAPPPLPSPQPSPRPMAVEYATPEPPPRFRTLPSAPLSQPLQPPLRARALQPPTPEPHLPWSRSPQPPGFRVLPEPPRRAASISRMLPTPPIRLEAVRSITPVSFRTTTPVSISGSSVESTGTGEAITEEPKEEDDEEGDATLVPGTGRFAAFVQQAAQAPVAGQGLAAAQKAADVPALHEATSTSSTPALLPLFSHSYNPSPTSVSTDVPTPVTDDEDTIPGPIRLDALGNLIPPGREADMIRRNLSAPPTPPKPTSVAAGKQPAPPAPPLQKLRTIPDRLLLSIGGTGPNPQSPSAVSPDMLALAESSSALLNLLEEADTRPIAESSAQGAAKAAVVQAFRFELAHQREIEARIHEDYQRAHSQASDRSDADDELPGYESGDRFFDLAEKEQRSPRAPSRKLTESEIEEMMDSSGTVSKHARSRSDQYLAPPAPDIRRNRINSHTRSLSHSPLSSAGNSFTPELEPVPATPAGHNDELRNRPPALPPSRPPPKRPPPPPPPPKQSLARRPPPPPPPMRSPPAFRSPTGRGVPVTLLDTQDVSPDFGSLGSQESLLDPRDAGPLSLPSTVWKSPCFGDSPLDPHPPMHLSRPSPLDPFPPSRLGVGFGAQLQQAQQGVSSSSPLATESATLDANGTAPSRPQPRLAPQVIIPHPAINTMRWNQTGTRRIPPPVPPPPNRSPLDLPPPGAVPAALRSAITTPRQSHPPSSASSMLGSETSMEERDAVVPRRPSRTEGALVPIPPRSVTANGSAGAPLARRSPASSVSHSSDHPTSLSNEATDAPIRSPEITDLDLFVARMEGSSREYEDMSHLTEFLGPAKPKGANQDALSTLLPGAIEIDSRRVNAKGKVKLKLSILGVRVSNCPVCLAQYRGGDAAVLLPRCSHAAHEACARRWFRESDLCMVCREPLVEKKD